MLPSEALAQPKTRRAIEFLRRGRLVLAACALALASPGAALATPILTLGLKLIPVELTAGSTVELPLLLIENRSPGSDVSLFANGDRLAQVYSQVITDQSTLVSFTPDPAFTSPFVTLTDHRLDFNLLVGAGVDTGLPVTVDNTPIDGRTEIEIGKLKVEVGPTIPGDPPIIFFVDLSTDHSVSNNAVKQFSGTDIRESLGGIFSSTIEIIPPIPPVVIPADLRKKIVVAADKVKIKGTASDDVTVKSVQAKVNAGPYKELALVPTVSTTKVKWTLRAKLKPGRNVIKFRATDNDDNPSDVVKKIYVSEP